MPAWEGSLFRLVLEYDLVPLRAIGKAVADHARENGIHIVLKKQDMELAGPESIEQNLRLATTEVLFADPALEITDAVVARLNAGYPGPLEVE